MSEKTSILVQLDTDAQPSVFDRVVAIDAGVQQLFSYGHVTPDQVQGLVHGAMFTRGPADLKRTAVFIGGSNVARGEEILAIALKTFFGPLRVSVMLDANGANTTAAAAVFAVRRHLTLRGSRAVVLAGTGPVGQRAARLLARQGVRVRLASRSIDRAAEAAEAVNAALRLPVGGAAPVEGAEELVEAVATGTAPSLLAALEGADAVISAGAAGAMTLPASVLREAKTIKVLIDLNAVPPAGIEGVAGPDKGKEVDGRFQYGALGVGGTKMKIHKAAIASLFTANDRVLDAEGIYAIGETLV
ncbi:MAG: methylenetetrahydromethanopterin dehydrogenase [Planctomycetota bacterium]|nr:methylenetetrahydromethanopterin dehydrogenase [Planctomycetota bacterium]